MDRWDNNVDGYDIYKDWDTNSDDVLVEDELDTGLFNTIDKNGDGLINEEEYETWDGIDLK